jgi:hypothetical protein
MTVLSLQRVAAKRRTKVWNDVFLSSEAHGATACVSSANGATPQASRRLLGGFHKDRHPAR